MVYREVIYKGEGNDVLNILMKRLKEIEEREEDIIAFVITTIG